MEMSTATTTTPAPGSIELVAPTPVPAEATTVPERPVYPVVEAVNVHGVLNADPVLVAAARLHGDRENRVAQLRSAARWARNLAAAIDSYDTELDAARADVDLLALRRHDGSPEVAALEGLLAEIEVVAGHHLNRLADEVGYLVAGF